MLKRALLPLTLQHRDVWVTQQCRTNFKICLLSICCYSRILFKKKLLQTYTYIHIYKNIGIILHIYINRLICNKCVITILYINIYNITHLFHIYKYIFIICHLNTDIHTGAAAVVSVQQQRVRTVAGVSPRRVAAGVRTTTVLQFAFVNICPTCTHTHTHTQKKFGVRYGAQRWPV